MKQVGYKAAQLRPRKNVKAEKWEPLKWEANYEEIVNLSTRGYSNTYLAQKFGYHKQHISNILQTTEAQTIRSQVIEHMRAGSIKNAEERLAACYETATKRIYDTLHDDELYENAKLSVMDRSMSFLTRMGKMKGENDNSTTTNNVVIGDEAAARILAGLRLSDQAKSMHKGITGDSIN
jgi:hypothetical protein